MSWSTIYAHLLVPEDPGFIPEPHEIMVFFAEFKRRKFLVARPSYRFVPRNPVVAFGKPFTKEAFQEFHRRIKKLRTIADIARAIDDHLEFDVIAQGQGPPKRPPCPVCYLEDDESLSMEEAGLHEARLHAGEYDYTVSCKVRPRPVWLSCHSSPQGLDDLGFDCPANRPRKRGYFPHPLNRRLIRVTNAAQASFWIEFGFEQGLGPVIRDSFEVLDPAIVQLAEDMFGPRFVQACHLMEG